MTDGSRYNVARSRCSDYKGVLVEVRQCMMSVQCSSGARAQ